MRDVDVEFIQCGLLCVMAVMQLKTDLSALLLHPPDLH
jgi:hypothetical protein